MARPMPTPSAVPMVPTNRLPEVPTPDSPPQSSTRPLSEVTTSWSVMRGSSSFKQSKRIIG